MIRDLLAPLYRADAWLTAPAPSAAGRLGLYRILYALFYLWYLATQQSAMVSVLPRFYSDNPVWIMRAFPKPPSATLMHTLESLLAGLLVLLLFGLCTRSATLLVILVGTVLEGYITTVDAEQGNILLVFFIPCFMFLAGNWGAAYSLDRALRYRAGRPVTDPTAPGAAYMASRLLMVFISFQFVLAAVYKLTGTWLTQPRLIGNLMLSNSVDAEFYGIYVNPFAKIIADTPLLYHGLQWTALLFELCFFLCLLGPRLRVLIFSVALIFHSLNAYLLWVTFTNILIVYPAFMDWQSLYERQRIGRFFEPFRAVPTAARVSTAVGIALIVALTWNSPLSPRSVLTIGGLIDFQTI